MNTIGTDDSSHSKGMDIMTIEVLNLGDSVSVDIAALSAAPKSSFALVDTVDDKNGSREAVYQKTAGDEEYPMTVRVGHYVNGKANDGVGQTNMSVKISTFVQKSDTDDVIYTLPGTVTIAMSMPGQSGIPDTADITEILGNAMSYLLPVVSGAIATSALDELKFGVVTGIMDHADSGSA